MSYIPNHRFIITPPLANFPPTQPLSHRLPSWHICLFMEEKKNKTKKNCVMDFTRVAGNWGRKDSKCSNQHYKSILFITFCVGMNKWFKLRTHAISISQPNQWGLLKCCSSLNKSVVVIFSSCRSAEISAHLRGSLFHWNLWGRVPPTPKSLPALLL